MECFGVGALIVVVVIIAIIAEINHWPIPPDDSYNDFPDRK